MKHNILGLIATFAACATLSSPGAVAWAGDLPPGATPAIAAPSAMPTIGIDDVRPGQKGYGLSVFTGTEPERFDVEIVGVMRNAGPELNYILARLNGKGLERSGVASGMSGSPVFIDGKLAGAVAFSWPFSHEAIAGIMPIESMRRLSTLGGGMPVTPPPPPVDLADLRAGKIPKDLLVRELSRLQPKVAMDGRAGVQWAVSGFGEQSQALLRTALGSAAPAGQAAAGGSRDLILGGAVAAVLADGDFRMAAIGTVTDRYDDQVLAFGHPFLGLGPIRVPMATAEVVTVLSNAYSSFKISNLGETIGAFEQDRQAGIQGRIGQTAPMTPVTVRIAGVGVKPREYHSRIADVPMFTPMLIGSSVLSGIDSASYTAGAQSIDLDARFRLRGHGDVRIRQSFDGDSAATDVAAYVLAVAGYLVQNPLEKVAFDEIEVDISQSPQPRAATLVGANADRTVVRPGDTVTLSLDLVAWRGERFRRSMELTLPEDVPAGRYSLIVGDGSSVDAARMALEPASPVTFPQALDFLRGLHSRRELMVLGVYGGPGLAVAGEIMPRLPGSVRSLWGAAASGSATPLRVTIAQEHREDVDIPVDGAVRIDLEVRRSKDVDPTDRADPTGLSDPIAQGEKAAA
jgi:SpoIVB peptidase S55